MICDLGDMTSGQGHDTHGSWTIQAQTWIFNMCKPWPLRYDMGPRSWHTLGSWTTIVWNIQIQHNRIYGPDKNFGFECTWLWRYDLGQSRDSHLIHGQQLREISRFNIAVQSYCLDKDFECVHCTLRPLRFELWVKFMANPLLMDNNRVKYYPDPTLHYSKKLWPGHRFGGCMYCVLGDITRSRSWHTLSQKLVRSYGLYIDFGYACTVTLTLDIWPLGLGLETKPLFIDNNCVIGKYQTLQ